MAGHPGAVAVSADDGPWRDLLYLNPATGVIVGYEQVLLRDGHLLGVHTPYSNQRFAVRDQGRSRQPGQVPPAAAGS